MTPKDKQDYGIKYHRESQRIYGIKQGKKKKRERERAKEIRRKEGSGIKWNVKEKRDDGILWVYVCGGQNAREKKKKKRKRRMKCMDERKAKNQKSQFKNTTTIFSQ